MGTHAACLHIGLLLLLPCVHSQYLASSPRMHGSTMTCVRFWKNIGRRTGRASFGEQEMLHDGCSLESRNVESCPAHQEPAGPRHSSSASLCSSLPASSSLPADGSKAELLLVTALATPFRTGVLQKLQCTVPHTDPVLPCPDPSEFGVRASRGRSTPRAWVGQASRHLLLMMMLCPLARMNTRSMLPSASSSASFLLPGLET